MMNQVILITAFISLGLIASSEEVSLDELVEESIGKEFSVSGPNCFGMALKLSGVIPTYRGVDIDEFEWQLEKHCSEIDRAPQKGDVGVYWIPKANMAIHAFLKWDNTHVIEKRGVGFGERNKILKSPFYQTNAIYGVSTPLCLQFTPSPDCYNHLRYYECTPSKDERFEVEIKIESLIDQIVQGQSSVEKISQLEALVGKAQSSSVIAVQKVSGYTKQLQYIQKNISSNSD